MKSITCCCYIECPFTPICHSVDLLCKFVSTYQLKYLFKEQSFTKFSVHFKVHTKRKNTWKMSGLVDQSVAFGHVSCGTSPVLARPVYYFLSLPFNTLFAYAIHVLIYYNQLRNCFFCPPPPPIPKSLFDCASSGGQAMKWLQGWAPETFKNLGSLYCLYIDFPVCQYNKVCIPIMTCLWYEINFDFPVL